MEKPEIAEKVLVWREALAGIVALAEKTNIGGIIAATGGSATAVVAGALAGVSLLLAGIVDVAKKSEYLGTGIRTFFGGIGDVISTVGNAIGRVKNKVAEVFNKFSFEIPGLEHIQAAIELFESLDLCCPIPFWLQ